MADYTQLYSGLGWGTTFEMNAKKPLIAKRSFPTLDDAYGYVNDLTATGTACQGLIIAVTADANDKNNGIYWIKSIGVAGADGELIPGELIKAGSGTGSMAVDTLTVNEDKVAEATADNIGQIIYVTTGTEVYPAGPYIVTGDGAVAKLGTTTATGDIAGDVESLKGRVGTLENTVGDSTKGLVKDVADIKDNYVAKVDGQRLMTDAEGTKLAGIAEGAEVNFIKSVGDNLIVDENGELTVSIPDVEVPNYTVAKLDTAEEGYAASYQLQKDGVGTGAVINIPKDMVVSSGEVRGLTEDEITDERPQGVYVVLTLANATNDTLYIPANKLVDDYTGSEYVDVADDGEITVKYDDLKSALKNDFDAVYEAIGAAATVKGEITETLKEYAKTSEVTNTLKEYAKTSEVTNTLADYVKGTELETTLSGYVTTGSLTTTLGGYVTTGSLTDTLADYIKGTELETTLSDYVKKDDDEIRVISDTMSHSKSLYTLTNSAGEEGEYITFEVNTISEREIKSLMGIVDTQE